MNFISHKEEETKVIAETLGRGLKPGSIILAYGTLGAVSYTHLTLPTRMAV